MNNPIYLLPAISVAFLMKLLDFFVCSLHNLERNFNSIRSVKVSNGKNIPKAFEIFTDDQTFVLKAKDSSNAHKWIQVLVRGLGS